MGMPAWNEYGQTAYAAYVADAGGKSLVSGAALPAWADLDPKIQHAWSMAGQAVLQKESDNRSALRRMERGDI